MNMKKNKLQVEKTVNSVEEIIENISLSEEETLDLDSLLEIQGGKDHNDDRDLPNCGLGCYTGGI